VAKQGAPARGDRAGPEQQQPQALRSENARLARITRGLRRIYNTGERLSVELVLEFARWVDAFDTLEQLVHRFSAADPETLAAFGGQKFPESPIRFVTGGRR
jgi:hypothetical protein